MDDDIFGVFHEMDFPLLRTNSYADDIAGHDDLTVPDADSKSDKPRTRRCVTAYDDLVPVAWKDVPEGEPDPEPMYLSTSAARLYMGLDQGHEVTVRGERPVITPVDVDEARKSVRVRRFLGTAMTVMSALVVIISFMGGPSVLVGAMGVPMFVLSLAMLTGSLTDTTHLLIKAAFAQQRQGQVADIEGILSDKPLIDASSDEDGTVDDGKLLVDASDDRGKGTLEENSEQSYRESMGRRADAICYRLDSVRKSNGRTASSLVIDTTIMQMRRVPRAYAVAMSSIEQQFEPASMSWQRFAHGAKAGYEKVLDNGESVATCLESLDMSEYDGHMFQLSPDEQLVVPMPSPAYEKTHASLIKLVQANSEVLETLTRMSCDLTGMTADEATDGTADVTEYLQSLVDDIPEYKTGRMQGSGWGYESSDGTDDGTTGGSSDRPASDGTH